METAHQIERDEEYYRMLCERLRVCWRSKGMAFTNPPATEAQIAATEDRRGFSLPPMLKMLYREVANGGNSLVWYDEQFPFSGTEGGCPMPHLGFPDAPLWRHHATIAALMSRSGWRLHHCIEEALQRCPDRYVICDELPDSFMTLSCEGPGVSVLDAVSGGIYRADFEGELPLDDGTSAP